MENRLILSFLAELSQNNSMEWMHASKPRYVQAKAAFEELLSKLMSEVAPYDASIALLSPGELVFRMNRDTRFSHDKSPYNPSFRAHISSRGRTPIPVGYYLCIKPGASFLGGGLFASQFPSATAIIRDAIVEKEEMFRAIIEAPAFAKHFTMVGERLKGVPNGYDKMHPLAEYIKHKAWAVEYPISDECFSDDAAFLSLAGEQYRHMKPFNDFLNEALARGQFIMPERPK